MSTRPDPNPAPQPDTITPIAPPENPVQPTPIEEPAHQPTELPGGPGGGDIDEPGKGPDELPAR